MEQRFAELAQRMSRSAGGTISREEAAAGALKIAVGSMANAVKRISVARGYDVTRYTLQCFGGAGGQHACLVADALGMEHIFCHPLAGVLSAYGMGLADQIAMRGAALERVLDEEAVAEARELAARLTAEAGKELEIKAWRRNAYAAWLACTCAIKAPIPRCPANYRRPIPQRQVRILPDFARSSSAPIAGASLF